MTILVTGSTGTVGSHVLEELRKRDAHARVLVRKQPATPPEAVELAVGDLLDPVSVEKAIRGVDKLYLPNAGRTPSSYSRPLRLFSSQAAPTIPSPLSFCTPRRR